jgi:hypothetical protein
MKVQYLLDGQEVNPINRRDISIEINHDQESVIDQPRPHVGINNLYLAREDVKKIIEKLSTTPGITEGIPFDIIITERGQQSIVNMYVDMMDGLKRSRNGIQASLKMVQSLDWLDDKADSFTFESLYNETGVTAFIIDSVSYNSYQEFMDRKTIYVPYVISSVPNYQDAFLALFSMTYVATQLYQSAKTIAQWATPMVGLGAVAGVLQLVLEILYSAILLLTLIALINQLFNSLIQPLKYHGSMLISDMLKLASVKLGLSFQSSIWSADPFNKLAYIPEKFSPKTNGQNLWEILGIGNMNGYSANGYTSPAYAPSSLHNSNTDDIQHGYMNGTGGDLFRLAKRLMNGKITIEDQSNVLKLERRDYTSGASTYQLPDLRADWNGYNTNELTANIIIKFAVDYTERNSVDYKTVTGIPFYIGTILQATHEQVVTTNKNLVNLKGLRQIDIPVCRGVMKDRLTFIEMAVEDLQILWDSIILLENIGVAAINVLIIALNAVIVAINILIGVWNLIIAILHVITDIINVIIGVVNTVAFTSIPEITVFNNGGLTIGYVGFIDPISFIPFTTYDFSNRLNALLVESDILNAAKVVMVDTARSEYVANRIAYLHGRNREVVNAQFLWDNFYFIDAFSGPVNNRRTLISPALNSPEDYNTSTLHLSEFKELVRNPEFTDGFGEPVTSDSVEWFLEQNGRAIIHYRKKGWLKKPESLDPFVRSEEIAINLKITLSTPNGQ